MTEQERLDYCYECSGYGDNYYYDDDAGELICNCGDCIFNGSDGDEE